MIKKMLAVVVMAMSGTVLAADPVLLQAVSRKTHGGAGQHDIYLSESVGVVEPRTGPNYSVVFTFDAPIVDAECYVAEGSATVAAAFIHNQTVTCNYSAQYPGQWVSIDVVVEGLNNTFAEAMVRVGLLPGDVNGDGQVTADDKALVNANVAQVVGYTNFKCDVNANGFLTVADVGITNSRIGTFLP